MTNFFSTFNQLANHTSNCSVLSHVGEPLRKMSLATSDDDKKSPFSIYPGDTHKLILPQKRTSVDEVDFLLSINFIGDVEKAILAVVNKMYFVTSLQIYQMLKIAGFDVEHKRIQFVIKKLKNKSFLKQIEFFSNVNYDSKSSFKAYTLGYHGMGVLRANGEIARLQGYISEQPTENIKKTLATNQLMISVMQETEATFESLLCLFEEGNSKEVIIRPRAVFQSKENTYLIECVRSEANWKEDLLERIDRYQKVIDRYAFLNISLERKPILIILAESYRHMALIRRLIPNTVSFNIIYSYDLALFDDVRSAFFVS